MSDFERHESWPKPGQNAEFDAGWNAHRANISLKTVEALSGKKTALGWKARNYLATEERDLPEDAPADAPPEQLTIEGAIDEAESEQE